MHDACLHATSFLRKYRCWLLAWLFVLMSAASQQIHAADDAAGTAGPETESFWWLFWFGAGWFGFVIMLLLVMCSVAALAVAIENIWSLRRSAIMPGEVADEVHQHLSQAEVTQAEQILKERRSVFSVVALAGLQEIRHGHEAAEKAMEETAQAEHARLHRRLEYLSLLSSIGPMLGLLGTVWGMVVAFQRVAETRGRADPGDLAGGIYQALYTTVIGLLIAIPGLACYGVLRNRIDQLTAECSGLAERVFAPLKRARVVKRSAESTSSKPGLTG